MPKISVVVPIYKTPKLKLRNCIESILNQSFSDFELLLIDDGNSQDYLEILKEYEKVDMRVIVISQKNQGVSIARNKGIEEAKGKYLCFVDSDDFVEESYLSKMECAIRNADLVICGVCEQDFPVDDGWNDKRMFFSQPNIYSGLQYLNFSVNKLYRLEKIREKGIRFDKGIELGEDALFLSRYFETCESIRCIPDMLYHYVPDTLSAVHKYQPDYWNWEKQVIEKQWNLFHKYPLSEMQLQAAYAWLFRKIRGAIYYYCDNVIEKKVFDERIKEIYAFGLFDEMRKNCTVQRNKCLSKKEKIILWLMVQWKMKGIMLIRDFRMLKKIKNG